jgi:hypothetical protein
MSVAVRGPINGNDIRFQLPLVESGVGIGMLPMLLASESIRAGRVARILGGGARKGAAIHLVHAPQPHAEARRDAARSHVYETLRRQLASTRPTVSDLCQCHDLRPSAHRSPDAIDPRSRFCLTAGYPTLCAGPDPSLRRMQAWGTSECAS